MGKYVKCFDLFEKINPRKFNMDFVEDPEDEEDDNYIYDELSDNLIGGDIYKGTLSFVLLSPKNGELHEIKYEPFKESIFGWINYNRWPPKYEDKLLFDINLIVEKLNIIGKTKNGNLQISNDKKKRYSISSNTLFKGDKLSNFYIRPNDVLAFDKESLSEGLQAFYQKHIKLFKFIYKYSISKPQIPKIVEEFKNKIISIKKKLEGLEFVLNNIDKFKSYYFLDEKTIKNDKYKFEELISITEKEIKTFIDIDAHDNVETYILDKIKNLR